MILDENVGATICLFGPESCPDVRLFTVSCREQYISCQGTAVPVAVLELKRIILTKS